MNKLIWIYIIIISCFNSKAQSEVYGKIEFNGNTYSGFSIKINDSSIKNFFLFENINSIDNKEIVEEFNLNFGSDNYFFTNAGIIDSINGKCHFKGLLIDNYNMKNDLNLKDGNGNFFLKPNGALVLKLKPSIIASSILEDLIPLMLID